MKNKKAFSLVEVLIVLVIIGFMVIAELCILNNKVNNYNQPYYTVYHALKKAAYNVLADMYCPDPDSDDDECKVGAREFPDNSEDLCKRLAEFINTSKAVCKGTEIANDAKNIDPNNPWMVSSNAMRFYFSGLKKTKAPDLYGNENELQYFIVYVDLNGEKKPNRLTCDGTKTYPDIVPFAITRRGDVVPMGFPMFSNLYMTAQVKLPTGMNLDTDDSLEDKRTGSLSYYNAIHTAWAKAEENPSGGSPYSGNVQRNIDIPFSIVFDEDTAYLNSNIRQCYSGGQTGVRTLAQYKNEAANIYREKYLGKGCEAGTFNCRVVIDRNKNTRW